MDSINIKEEIYDLDKLKNYILPVLVIDHRVDGDIKTFRSDFQKCDQTAFDNLAFKDTENLQLNVKINKNRLCADTKKISEFFNL